jgi:hypothetical protein
MWVKRPQELPHRLSAKVSQVEVLKTPSAVLGGEAQEQDQGIAVAMNGVLTHAAQFRQILAEEFLHAEAKVVWAGALHGVPPLIR